MSTNNHKSSAPRPAKPAKVATVQLGHTATKKAEPGPDINAHQPSGKA
jgi:hypothetical protein